MGKRDTGTNRKLAMLWTAFAVFSGDGRAQEGESGGDYERQPGSTWETRPNARAMTLKVPAPRGQIVDRHGVPLAVNRVAHYLALNFATLEDPSDEEILSYAEKRTQATNFALGKTWSIEPKDLVRHYRNRRWLPLTFGAVLGDEEIENVNPLLDAGLILHPVYHRFYPRGTTVPHVIGYVGKTRPLPAGPIENGEPLFIETDGRDGLELYFDEQLAGTPGQINVFFDGAGSKLAEEMVRRPIPGHNVVTTLDLEMQETAEEVLEEKVDRGAFVLMDIYSGDVLVMGTWPLFDPNDFIPSISREKFDALQNDPAIPMYARAFRGLYPPASIFKIPVALAALESRAVGIDTFLECSGAITIGDREFHNWHKGTEGMMNVVTAITRSCNTWFYEAGMKTGSYSISSMAMQLGLGIKTGIPLRGEPDGFVPTDEFMGSKYGGVMGGGDLANLAIGQGLLQVSPLQLAQMMAGVAHGKSAPRAKLVRQLQSQREEIIQGFPDERRGSLNLSPDSRSPVVQGMIKVVNAGNGTGRSAGHPYMEIAGKTGTAQWGNLIDRKYVAWFAGFFPARFPRYSFAALYEGDPGEKLSGGRFAAPIVGEFLKRTFEKERSEVVLAEAKSMAAERPWMEIAVAEVVAAPIMPELIEVQEPMQGGRTEGLRLFKWFRGLRRR